MDQWVVGSDPSERFPLWTRANVGEVFPDPVQPLTFTLMIEETVEGAFRDAFVEMGAFTHDEFTEGKMEMLGVFGSYCYLNASLFRIFGERAPGLSAEDIDALFSAHNLGSQHMRRNQGILTQSVRQRSGRCFSG